MTQLHVVLRRSIAHLDPSDQDGRERVFASARQAMVRLLERYEPPLSNGDIDGKIAEFDAIIGGIEDEFRRGLPGGRTELPPPPGLAIGGPTPAGLAADDTTAGAGRTSTSAPPATVLEAPDPAGDTDAAEPAETEDEAAWDAADPDEEEDFYDEEDDGYSGDGTTLLDRLGGLGRWIAIALAALLLAGAIIAGGAYLYARLVPARGTAPVTPDVVLPSPPAPDASAPTAPAPPAPAPVLPQAAAPAPSPGAPQPVASSGALALETLVLFDGRDPSVFQSAPDNPVRFQGDTDGGYAQISSSSGSTGARLLVGRGVYDRIAGRSIRLVVVARGSREAPASSLRFAYQNGRNVSPWLDTPITGAYQPLSLNWQVPKERGGPENDAVIIEPGIPGDDTAADIRSVRIEVLQ